MTTEEQMVQMRTNTFDRCRKTTVVDVYTLVSEALAELDSERSYSKEELESVAHTAVGAVLDYFDSGDNASKIALTTLDWPDYKPTPLIELYYSQINS